MPPMNAAIFRRQAKSIQLARNIPLTSAASPHGEKQSYVKFKVTGGRQIECDMGVGN